MREGFLIKLTIEEGQDEAWTAGGREEASGGGIERGREGAREWKFKGCILRRAVYNIHKPSHNAALAIDTLLLQMKNSEQVYIIYSVYCLSGG